MQYYKVIRLKNGQKCILRNGREQDGEAVLQNFLLTHAETDYLLTYPEEMASTPEQEGAFLKGKEQSDIEMELLAEIDGVVIATAGIASIGGKRKIKHRAEFGISIAKAYWGLGIGSAMTATCIESAKAAGYEQLELEAVAENSRALALYKKMGFVEYGRNPKGFKTEKNRYQELVYMRIEL